jgi:hypothetical protein
MKKGTGCAAQAAAARKQPARYRAVHHAATSGGSAVVVVHERTYASRQLLPHSWLHLQQHVQQQQLL